MVGRVEPAKKKKGISLFKEFDRGGDFRQFTLFKVVDQAKISAKMDDEVTSLVLPEVEAAKPQRIEVITG